MSPVHQQLFQTKKCPFHDNTIVIIVILDPCADFERADLPDDGHRAATCAPNDLCDSDVSGWYRVHKTDDEDSAIQMTDTCPEPGNCGATSPIWLEDTHPSPEDGIVTRSACVRNETDCCGERFQIQVVNCQSYYVYELKARSTCPERYCFGHVSNGNSCLQGNDTIVEGNNANSLQDNTILKTVLAFQFVMWFVMRCGV
ncbi:pancreatic secretory granule membrane major glycoprotein GP2-like [Argopecten irradians]|uniref:pancreatic secretory granule membrane major glycoprotein GP2-like n=1 Tax=Argopecten irradians TaxID=31199 RepID=UPI00371156A2